MNIECIDFPAPWAQQLDPEGGSSLGRAVPEWAFYLGVAMAKTEASEDATCHGVGEAADGSLKALLMTNK